VRRHKHGGFIVAVRASNGTVQYSSRKLTKQEVAEYKQRLAETTDLKERAKILRELSERVSEARELAAR
jgi:hypothetical protein